MQLHGISATARSGVSTSRQDQQTGASFQDDLAAAMRNSDSSSGNSSTVETQSAKSSSSANDPVQAFRDYMSETPGQRMFDAFLGAHHISKEQYAAMSPSEKAKIQAEFEAYVKQKAQGKLGLDGNTGNAAS